MPLVGSNLEDARPLRIFSEGEPLLVVEPHDLGDLDLGVALEPGHGEDVGDVNVAVLGDGQALGVEVVAEQPGERLRQLHVMLVLALSRLSAAAGASNGAGGGALLAPVVDDRVFGSHGVVLLPYVVTLISYLSVLYFYLNALGFENGMSTYIFFL